MTRRPQLPSARRKTPRLQVLPARACSPLKTSKAYYRTRHFGIEREVRRSTASPFEVRDKEIPASPRIELGQFDAAQGRRRRHAAAPAASGGRHGPDALLRGGKSLQAAFGQPSAAQLRWRKLSYISAGAP